MAGKTMRSMRTPMARVRGLGAAKEGVHHWWMQRLTAIALVPLTLWFVVAILSMVGADHAAVKAWMAQPLPAVLTVLLIVATFHHAQLGLQVVVEDYVHHEGAKLTLIVAIKFAALALAALAVFAVLKLAFGG
jgi:succinate dehydrogenase / fumarate reductase membrane anchor subunit